MESFVVGYWPYTWYLLVVYKISKWHIRSH